MNQSSFIQQVQIFEGNRNHFYLDTVGEVTIGVGLMFKTVQAVYASHIQFYKKTDGFEATKEEIKEDFDTVKSMAKGLGMSKYDQKTKLIASTVDLDALFDKRWKNATADAIKFYQDGIGNDAEAVIKKWDDLPIDVQLAVTDMSFNLGYNRLSKYKNFRSCLRKADFVKAAEESHRRGIQSSRNQKIYDMIKNAIYIPVEVYEPFIPRPA